MESLFLGGEGCTLESLYQNLEQAPRIGEFKGQIFPIPQFPNLLGRIFSGKSSAKKPFLWENHGTISAVLCFFAC